MSDFYTEMQAVASELLTEFAQGSVSLIRVVPGVKSGNEWEPPTSDGIQTWTLNATVKGVSAKYINGDSIIASDLEVTVAVFDDEPNPGDSLNIDGKPVTIIQIMRIPAAGTVAAWKIIARG